MSLWLKSLIGFLLIVSVAAQMMPNEKYEQYLRLFTGFLLILLVLQPLLKIGSADSFLEGKIAEFVREQEQLEKQIGVESARFQEESDQVQGKTQEFIKVREIEPVKVEVTEDD